MGLAALFMAALPFVFADYPNILAAWTGDRYAMITRCPAANVGTTVEVPMADYPLRFALVALLVACVLAGRHKDVMAVRFAGATAALALVSSAVVSSSYLTDLLSRDRLGDFCTADGLPALDAQLRVVSIAYLNTSVHIAGIATLLTLVVALTPMEPAPSAPRREGRVRRTVALLIISVGVLTGLYWIVRLLALHEDPHLLLHAEVFKLLAVLTVAGLLGFIWTPRWQEVGKVALATAVGTAFTQWAFLYGVALDQYVPKVRAGDEGGGDIFYDVPANDEQLLAMNEIRDNYYGAYIIAILIVWALVWATDRLMRHPRTSSEHHEGDPVGSSS